jgi:hypothetical protein|tara:strand:+ start:202 stop:822 length:621 start_codon:yes stop_codon:yes gene_type:complete
MKKFTLFFIFFYFIFNIEGNASNNKTIKALENCANNAFIKSSVGPRMDKNEELKTEFAKDKKYWKLKTQSRIDAEISKKKKLELYKFIEDNFEQAPELKKNLINQLFKKVYSDPTVDINIPSLKFLSNSFGENLGKEDELKDRVSGLEYIMKIAHETSILEWDYRRDKFLVTSLNLKLTEKKYEKNFIRCELTRKKAPITFDAKWF